VRPTSRPEAVAELAALGVATFPGDVTERASMREAMSGAELVVHAAADLDLDGPRDRMEAVNVGGSENVASLAWKLGVGRLLQISSVAAFGGSPADGTPAVETTPPVEPMPTRYADTKRRGEAVVRGWAGRGLDVVTVYPSLVYGPPGKKEGANALLRQLWLGRFPFLIGARRRTSWVFLDDAVEGIVRAAAAAPGSAYLLAGEIAPVAEVAARLHALGGARAPRLELPPGAARLLLGLAAPFYRLRGRRTPIPLEQIASLSRHWAFDDSRARRELGWRPGPFGEGLAVTARELFAAAGAAAGAARGA
jgi:nucleoside-diphosphate-sugar epimerase